MQVRDDEAGEPGLGRRATAGRTLVADLATGTGRRPRERRDRRRVVVRLDLHEDVDVLLASGVCRRAVTASGQPALDPPAFHDGGVVLVGHDRARAGDLLGVPDHPEEALDLRLAVDDEVGVEDLVATVLGVGLREHHQLDVGRVALQPGERLRQIVDLVVGQREPVCRVRTFQRFAPAAEDVDVLHRLGLALLEQGREGLTRGEARSRSCGRGELLRSHPNHGRQALRHQCPRR